MTQTVKLPEFIQRQVEHAWRNLQQQYPDMRLLGKLQKTALIIYQAEPHPVKGRPVELPVALINWRADHWKLYFRGTQGRWEIMPDTPMSKHPRPLLYLIAQDANGLFWRQ